MFVVYDINALHNFAKSYYVYSSLEEATIDYNIRVSNKNRQSIIKEVELNQILFNFISCSLGSKETPFKLNTSADCESLFELYKEITLLLLNKEEEKLKVYTNHETNYFNLSDKFSSFNFNKDSFIHNNYYNSVIHVNEIARLKGKLEQIEEFKDKGFEEKLKFLQERPFIEVVGII